MRLSQPSLATQLRIHASSACSGAWLWTKITERSGSTPPGDDTGGDLARRPSQLRRVLGHRDRMQVDHAVDALVGILHPGPVADRAQVVAELEVSRRLNAREYPVHVPVLQVGCSASGIHDSEEILVVLGCLQLVEQEFHRIHCSHLGKDAAQYPHL